MEIEEIQDKIRKIIVEQVVLGGRMTAADIPAEKPLFEAADGGGLGFDSVEALELIVGIERGFGVKVPEGPEVKERFYSVKTLADYVRELKGGGS